jgi:hypothetical protein
MNLFFLCKNTCFGGSDFGDCRITKIVNSLPDLLFSHSAIVITPDFNIFTDARKTS